jgi:hypothetical protein
LAATGAKRIGVGGGMIRVALSAFVSTARDLLEGRELDGLSGAMHTYPLNSGGLN